MKDPHGAEIPEDFEHLVSGEVMTLAILREGHTGEVVQVGELIVDPVSVGDKVTVGVRENDSRTWVVTITKPDGQSAEHRFNHDEADDISVRLD